MSRIWTEPRDWAYGDTAGASVMNQHIRDNLSWLKLPPRDYKDVYNIGSNLTLAATTTAQALDDAQLGLTITTSEANEEVFLTMQGNVSMATAAQYLIADWLMDNTNFVSSGTPTQLGNGIQLIYCLTAGIAYPFYMRKRVVVATAGLHTFKPRFKISTTNNTITFFTNTQHMEVGVQVE